MRLNIMSDLHLEFGTMPVPTEGDVLVLAGDITVGPKLPDWVKKAINNFDKTIMVLGNHEFYNHEYNEIIESWSKHSELCVLHNNHIDYDGVRFIGSTMWTPFPTFTQFMNDYQVIHYNGQILTPQNTKRFNAVATNYLINAIETPSWERKVVITHHAPIPECVRPHYVGDWLNGCYHAYLNELIENNDIPLWIHGHMHDSIDFVYVNTRIVCNPRGYINENRNFCLNKIVEI